jgi:hypothetical protein
MRYTAPDGGFSVAHPADWRVLSRPIPDARGRYDGSFSFGSVSTACGSFRAWSPGYVWISVEVLYPPTPVPVGPFSPGGEILTVRVSGVVVTRWIGNPEHREGPDGGRMGIATFTKGSAQVTVRGGFFNSPASVAIYDRALQSLEVRG